MTNEEILAKRAKVLSVSEISPQLHKWAKNFHIDGINKNKNKNSTFTHYVGLHHHDDKLKSKEGLSKSYGTHPELRKDLANMHKRTAKNIGPSHPDFENHVKLANYHHENAKTKNETASEISGVEMASAMSARRFGLGHHSFMTHEIVSGGDVQKHLPVELHAKLTMHHAFPHTSPNHQALKKEEHIKAHEYHDSKRTSWHGKLADYHLRMAKK